MKKTYWLRNLLLVDAAVLFWLGGLFILVPKWIEAAFHFRDLPPGVNYLMGLWGCVFLTLGFGYVVAASDPLRHVVWVQIGIARGLLECALGLFYLSTGLVSFSQAGFGIIVAGILALAYILLYPRPAANPATPIPSQPPGAS